MGQSIEFVYQRFKDYYKDQTNLISAPSSIKQREFGYLILKEGFMVRHLRFNSIDTLRSALAEIVPSNVYHSCAYYENPDYDMDKKGWFGSDLVFDIDADHIPTSCNKIHDEYTCIKCGFSGKGVTPESCPICENTKFETKTWPCDLCIESAREETIKLIDILEQDFGFSQDELHVFFSGHRGYHVHIESEVVRSLDSMARKEIVDYVTGLGLIILEDNKKRYTRGKHTSSKFSLHDFGWNRRLKVGMKEFLDKSTEKDLKVAGLKNKKLLENRDIIIERAINKGRWESIKGVSLQTWIKLAEYIKEKQSSKIDTVVTTDIHRLIRMNGTLHGKTGLKKVEFSTKELQNFDPFVRAVAFKRGRVKVLVFDAPEFRLGGETLGPYRNQTVELSTAAAVMLVCKRRAEVIL